MAYPYQGRDLRMPTGKIRPPHRKKRRYELGREPTLTVIGQKRIKHIRVRGGNEKVRLRADQYVNVIDPETGKAQKVKIIKFVENPADRNLSRMNVITKGTIVETEIGKVKITSRPGQDGTLNGVLIKE
jgi:small subunit ribosomal protein S8e